MKTYKIRVIEKKTGMKILDTESYDSEKSCPCQDTPFEYAFRVITKRFPLKSYDVIVYEIDTKFSFITEANIGKANKKRK